jgi:hypothetical protein
MKEANLAVRFALEVSALAAFAYWGLEVGSSTPAKVVLAIVAPATMIAVWGAWIAPRASRRLADPGRLVAELVIFGLATVALAHAGQPVLAALFAVIVAVNEALLYAWGQRRTA